MALPWHNPVLLAEQAATLDLISGGRLDFGVGRGYRHMWELWQRGESPRSFRGEPLAATARTA